MLWRFYFNIVTSWARLHATPHNMARVFVLCALLVMLAFTRANIAHAASIIVASGEAVVLSNGQCSLREAIINANDDAQTYADCAGGNGADIITLPSGTYTVDGFANDSTSITGDLDIDSDITMNGAGASTTILQAAFSPGTADDRVLEISSGAVVVLNDLTIRNGKSPDGENAFQNCTSAPCSFSSHGSDGQDGGGILNDGDLTLNRVVLSNNRGGSGGDAGNITCSSGDCNNSGGQGGEGGGIYNSGTLAVNSSTFSNNQAGSGGAAGTVSCGFGQICFSSEGIAGRGGAIHRDPFTIAKSSFSSNTSPGNGGAVLCITSSVIRSISDSSFTSNSTGGFGGAVYCSTSASGSCTISGSTFSGNSSTDNAAGGGAIAYVSSAGTNTITNSTLSGNTANRNAGGIYSQGTMAN